MHSTMTIDELADEPTRKHNRVNSRRPRGGIVWCGKCDRQLVVDGQKCKVCGAVQYPNRRKKNDAI